MSILETSYLPKTVTNVSDNYISVGTNVTVTITLNGALNTGEYLYIRYTTDNYATNTNTTVAPVTNGNNPYTVVIPGASVTGTSSNNYYVFTSNSLSTPTNANADYLTLNYGNNGGVNYPLPVELTSFTAALNANTVNLKWQTATEVNNYGFEIQRATSNQQSANLNWEKIGFVKGSGNSNSVKQYSFEDNGVASGNYSYRLKQIDNNGQYKYSSVVEINAAQMPNGILLNQNYPNPFNPSTQIQFGVSKNSPVILTIYNILGEKVSTLFSGNAVAGQVYNISFNGDKLASGIYYYKLQTNDKTEVKKMLLMK